MGGYALCKKELARRKWLPSFWTKSGPDKTGVKHSLRSLSNKVKILKEIKSIISSASLYTFTMILNSMSYIYSIHSGDGIFISTQAKVVFLRDYFGVDQSMTVDVFRVI